MSIRRHLKNAVAVAVLAAAGMLLQGCSSREDCSKVDSLTTLESNDQDGACMECIYELTGSDPSTICIHTDGVDFACPWTQAAIRGDWVQFNTAAQKIYSGLERCGATLVEERKTGYWESIEDIRTRFLSMFRRKYNSCFSRGENECTDICSLELMFEEPVCNECIVSSETRAFAAADLDTDSFFTGYSFLKYKVDQPDAFPAGFSREEYDAWDELAFCGKYAMMNDAQKADYLACGISDSVSGNVLSTLGIYKYNYVAHCRRVVSEASAAEEAAAAAAIANEEASREEAAQIVEGADVAGEESGLAQLRA